MSKFTRAKISLLMNLRKCQLLALYAARDDIIERKNKELCKFVNDYLLHNNPLNDLKPQRSERT